MGFPGGSVVKNVPTSRRCKRCGFDPWVGKILWRRKWQPTAVFLPGESHGQRSLTGYSPWGYKRVGHNLAKHSLVLKTMYFMCYVNIPWFYLSFFFFINVAQKMKHERWIVLPANESISWEPAGSGYWAETFFKWKVPPAFPKWKYETES